MENKIEKTAIGILAIVLLSLGVAVLPNDTHYSDCLNITMHCERLSSTGLTCYPNTDTTKGKKYSSCGWTSIIKDSIPIDSDTSAKQYLCSSGGCIPIN